MSWMFVSTGMGSVSCASWGALWLSGHMRPHAGVCTLQTGRGLHSFSEISVKLDHFSHLLAVSLTEDFTWLSLLVDCVHSVITYWELPMSQGLHCVLQI